MNIIKNDLRDSIEGFLLKTQSKRISLWRLMICMKEIRRGW